MLDASVVSWYLNMALLARASGNNFQFSNNYFYKFSLNWIKLKFNKEYPSSLAACKFNFTNARCIQTGPSPHINEKKYVVFDDVMAQRRDQAQRSILVQVQSEQSCYELYEYCSQFGKVQEMQHYTLNGSVNFVLIEFKTISDVKAISSVSTYSNAQQSLPVVSPMLWFRASPSENRKKSFSKDIPVTVKNTKVLPDPQIINNWLFKAKSVSDQMMVLYTSTILNDTDTRLRFLTARQLEMCLSGMFPNISVLPFGSSVNGFGKLGCDLDLVLKLQTVTEDNATARLVYHTKAGDSGERAQAQRVMETISLMMRFMLPGIMSIRNILQARVPIIKFNHGLTGLECDLSMTNTIGIHMSELLHLYGELDWRVRPLIFTIRMWAKCVGLTNSAPGNWITNFSLTLLVVFYLQQKQILPNLQHLVKLANKSDIRIADNCVDCTFLRDLSRLPVPAQQNKDILEDLLMNFFIYYSSFDFSTKAISLNTGTSLPKPNLSNIYIYNPLEQGLNVTKNMSVLETQRLKVEMRNAAWVLESATDNKSIDWGLLTLFQHKVQDSKTKSFNDGNKKFQVSTLFKESLAADNALNDTKPTSSSTSVSSELKSTSRSGNKHLDGPVTRNAKTRSSRNQASRR